MLTRTEIKWKRIARLSLAGYTKQVLPKYDQLYRWLGKDGLFLYNHAAELCEAGEYERSIAVFTQCLSYHNDMDVQMLLAYNNKEQGRYREAERHLLTAAAMCPVRFMPLYELAKLYDDAGRKDETLAMAKKIIDKDVKIPSLAITGIKNEMRQFIEAHEATANEPASVDHTLKPSGNNETRQGETPKAQSNGATLPP